LEARIGRAGAGAHRVPAAYILTVLGLAQFITAYDTTAMNVAVARVIPDLHTTVTGVQLALTTYTLVMASFMIVGGKLGDIWGYKKTFVAGVSLYGAGALTTALSPNLAVMILGWSIMEGLGSALMLPAVYALIPTIFTDGKERVKAFAVIGSVAGAGAALGPLLCGIIATYSSWRVSFAAEVLVVIVILLLQMRLKPTKDRPPRPRFDTVGGLLSIVGMGLLVMGILQANRLSTAGPVPVITLSLVGVLILGCFAMWENRQKRLAKATLVDMAMFKKKAVSLGLPITAFMTFMMAGSLFIIPVFQQIALGFSPIKSGLTLLPSTLAMIVVSQLVGRLIGRYGRKYFLCIGLALQSAGILTVAAMTSTSSSVWAFIPGALVMGTGIGLVMTTSLDLVQSSVPVNKQSEISGVSRAVFNLGSSLGTAVAGAVLIAVLIAGLTGLVSRNTVISARQKEKVKNAVRTSAVTMSDKQIEDFLETKHASAEVTRELIQINSKARNRALRVSLGAVGFIGLFGLVFAFMLPGDRPRRE
jgi:EmrB/QacA subfamily drug resistance transporter